MKIKRNNRLKVQLVTKKRLYWCNSCDGNHVSPGQKCSVCGHKDKTKKFKFQKNHQIDMASDFEDLSKTTIL